MADPSTGNGTTSTATTSAATTSTATTSAVFRIPPQALIAVPLLLFCATPVAFGGPPGLQVVYLLPIGVTWWVLRNRTVANAERIAVRRTLRTRELPWEHIRSLRVSQSRWIRAVLIDDREVPLPAVRATDLPVLASYSGGRVQVLAPTADEYGSGTEQGRQRTTREKTAE